MGLKKSNSEVDLSPKKYTPDYIKILAEMYKSKPIVAAVQLQEPFVYSCVLTNPMKNCKQKGINYDIFKALMSFMDIDFKLVEADEGTTGYQDQNGSWHGMIGQLVNGEIDMTASLMSQKPERVDPVDFSAPVSYYTKGFLVQRPEKNDLTALPTFLASPLSSTVWTYFAVSIVAMILIASVAKFMILGWSLQQLLDNFLQVVRVALRQTELDSIMTSIRLLLTFWEFSLFFLISFYTAGLTSSLLVTTKAKNPFEGMDQLADLMYRRKMTLITDDNPGKHQPLEQMTDESDPNQKMRFSYQYNPPIFLENAEEVVLRVAKNKSLVYIGSYYHLLDVSSYSCDVKVFEDVFFVPKWLSYAFPKGSKLQELVSLTLHTKYTSVNAFLQRLYRRYAKRRKCNSEISEKTRASDYFPLGLLQMQGALWVLGWGLVTGLVFVVIEALLALIYRVNKKLRGSMVVNTLI